MSDRNNELVRLENEVAEAWARTLGLSEVPHGVHFSRLGGDPEKGQRLVEDLNAKLGVELHLPMLLEAPTVEALAAYLQRYYFDPARPHLAYPGPADPASWRQICWEFPQQLESAPKAKNPQAIFVLCSPRCGSTLLRVLLGGSPALFSPPELHLLGYTRLAQRSQAMLGGWMDAYGLESALMELWQLDLAEARARVAAWVAEDLSIPEVYARLQAGAGNRRLVDKSPPYALSLQTLARAEEWFQDPLYIHLFRHPLPSIRSWRKGHLDHLLAEVPGQSPDTSQFKPEMTWLLSNENILQFLAGIPPERQCNLSFEAMVTQPEQELRRLSGVLGLEFAPSMIEPYQGKRMTEKLDGRAAGDWRYYQYSAIDAGLAKASARHAGDPELHPETAALATRLGYLDL